MNENGCGMVIFICPLDHIRHSQQRIQFHTQINTIATISYVVADVPFYVIVGNDPKWLPFADSEYRYKCLTEKMSKNSHNDKYFYWNRQRNCSGDLSVKRC